MMNPGWSAAQLASFKNLINTHHVVTARIQVLDLNHNHLGDLTNRFLAGQVDIDITSDVSRTLDMDILDPFYELGMDVANPNNGSMFMDKMIRCYYCVSPPNMSMSYDVPVFTGPINKMDRKGPILSVEAQGKERLALTTLRNALTYNKNKRVTSVIKDMLDLTGETRYNITTNTSRTTSVHAYAKDVTYWASAQSLASSLGYHMYYDGLGTLQLRPRVSSSVWSFNDANLLSYPQPGYTLDNVFNVVEVTGATPKGAKRAVGYRAVADRSHPLSPWTIGRGGQPRSIIHVVQDTSVRTTAKAKALALRTLKADLLMSLDTQFDALPNPLLEEYDPYRITTPTWADSGALQKMSLPLTADGVSSIGSNRKVTPRRQVLHLRSA